jgi:hypothetical protein
MARKVFGRISDEQTGGPIEGARVQAWDSDWPDDDDAMGESVTGPDGQYAIAYEGGHWDLAPHRITKWRPDIYIRVQMPLGHGQWIEVGSSGVRDDHPLRNNCEINLSIRRPSVNARTVWGKIAYRGNHPAGNVYVSAFDHDWGFVGASGGGSTIVDDDGKVVGAGAGARFDLGPSRKFMGMSPTNEKGEYRILYDGGHWDHYPHQTGLWRPDIFIVVRGFEEDRETGQLTSYKLGQSPVHSNVRHSDGVRIDLAVERLPQVTARFGALREAELAADAEINRQEMDRDRAALEMWRRRNAVKTTSGTSASEGAGGR